MNRKQFLRNTAITTIGLPLFPLHLFSSSNIRINQLKIGMIGVGLRGQDHVTELLKRNDVEIVAIADPDIDMINSTLKIFSKYHTTHPKLYPNGNYDYRNLLNDNLLDGVIISTPWKWHTSQCIETMKAGIPVGIEVGGAIHLDECWELIEVFESTQTPVFLMENVCYRRDIMAVLNMVRSGIFGELLHLQGGYQHDLRDVLFNDGKTPYGSGVEFGEKAFSEARWRTNHYLHRNGENYPTHGLGPISMMLDINRGNRLTYLSSIATKSRGLNRYISNHEKGGIQHPNAHINWKQGDIITTQIQTANGETIVLSLDTCNPRPYNFGFRVQGTQGLWQDTGGGKLDQGMIYLEQLCTKKHNWDQSLPILTKYDHPIWQKHQSYSQSSGHGGMDFFMINSFVECLKRQQPFPIDVYDYATWYSITPLSEQSISSSGSLQEIPDFTKGLWKDRKNIFGIHSDY